MSTQRVVAGMLAGLTTAAISLVAVAGPAFADQTITSSGPLTSIRTTPDLNCAVNHVGDTAGEFYNDTACGTFLAVDGSLFSPANVPAGQPGTAWVPISQTPVTGTGTEADPYKVVTVVEAVPTIGTALALQVTQTDSYVVGDEAYRTDVQVTNQGSATENVILYRAGDCYLQNSDYGFGVQYASGAVACQAADPVDPTQRGTRVEQWFPLTPGSHSYEAYYGDVWQRISNKLPFDDTCICSTSDDNGAGLSWSFSIPAGGSVTQSHLTSFSPAGSVPLTTAKTADDATASAGGTDGYTITISNTGAADVPLTQVTDHLPDGFTYTAGSTTGATTADPTVSGQDLTWNLSGVTVLHGQSVSLHFGVGVPCTTGTFRNSAGGDATGVPVVGVTDTAPVTVSGSCGQPADTTSVSGNSPTTQYSDPVTLTATLTDTTTGTPMGSAPVAITFNGTTAPVTTNSSGVASLTVPQVLLAPGNVPWSASYAGDSTHAASSGGGTVTVTKEACTLAYTGDVAVSSGTPVTLRAQLGESDTTHGDWSGHTVDFLLTDNAGATVGDPSDATDATGLASTTVTLPAGVYSVQARFPGDTTYSACSSSGNDLVTVAGLSSKITGGGFVVSGGHVSFGFNAASTSTGFTGQLQLRPGPHNRFHGSSVSALTVSGRTASWRGSGRWNNVSGYTFVASIADNRNGGSRAGTTPDTFAITVRNPSGAVIYSISGPLKGGNVTIH